MKNSHDSVTQGHCDLIGQIILGACSLPPRYRKVKKTWKNPKGIIDNTSEILRLIRINTRWAKQSKLLNHYCDVMKMDRQKIEEAILRNNVLTNS